MEIEANFLNGFQIDQVVDKGTSWQIKLQEGIISFTSSGFTQVLRKEPIFVNNLFLSEQERS